VSHGQLGQPLYVEGTVRSANGQVLDGAVIDIWHSDENGFNDVQRSDLEVPTFRARLHTDAQGQFHFWSIMPKFYPIPDDGPVGEMLKATGRHPYRPAHVHFLIGAPGHEILQIRYCGRFHGRPTPPMRCRLSPWFSRGKHVYRIGGEAGLKTGSPITIEFEVNVRRLDQAPAPPAVAKRPRKPSACTRSMCLILKGRCPFSL
jgi:hypothetical protein